MVGHNVLDSVVVGCHPIHIKQVIKRSAGVLPESDHPLDFASGMELPGKRDRYLRHVRQSVVTLNRNRPATKNLNTCNGFTPFIKHTHVGYGDAACSRQLKFEFALKREGVRQCKADAGVRCLHDLTSMQIWLPRLCHAKRGIPRVNRRNEKGRPEAGPSLTTIVLCRKLCQPGPAGRLRRRHGYYEADRPLRAALHALIAAATTCG